MEEAGIEDPRKLERARLAPATRWPISGSGSC